MKLQPSIFEIMEQNLRNTLSYLYRELQMPPDTIKLMVDGILTSFKVQDVYECERKRQIIPQGPEGS